MTRPIRPSGLAPRFVRMWIVATLLLFTPACFGLFQPESYPPLQDVGGDWTANLLGVDVRLSVSEIPYEEGDDLRTLRGGGWLVFGSPADSLPFSVGGTHSRERGLPLYVIVSALPDQAKWYGEFRLERTANGALEGNFRRRADRAPAFNPFSAAWPGTATSIPVAFQRQ